MCYTAGEFHVGGQDVLLGKLPGCDFSMWSISTSQLIIDVVPGRGGGFSLEAPEGVRFLLRSRLFSDAELQLLEGQGPLQREDQVSP